MAAKPEMICVEVAYATPTRQFLQEVEVAPDATVAEAIEASGVLAQFPEIDLTRNTVGVFSERRVLDDPLRQGDRVEIYRPLIADPKAMRRKRAAKRA
jgi:putative ubiquitin-RnfH superfamily antitoxin RatB of RatAB toxin-antitoxin module